MRAGKYIFFILFFQLLLQLSLQGQQDSHMLIGKSFQIDGELSPIMDEADGFFYFLVTDKNGQIEFSNDQSRILKFNHQLERVEEFKIQGKASDHPSLKPMSFFVLDSGFMLLCRHYSVKTREMKVYLILMDPQGKIIENVNPVTIEGVLDSDADYPFFRLFKMQDASASASIYTFVVTTPSFIESKERINFMIYNEHLQVLNTHLLDFPDDLIDYEIKDILCSDSGLFFIRVEFSNPFQDGEVVHQLVIYDIFNDDFNSLELAFKNTPVGKSAISNITDNLIAYYGYQVEGRHKNRPEGIFYYLFDAASGKLLKHHIHHFTSQEKVIFDPGNIYPNSDYQNLQLAGLHLMKHNHLLFLFEFKWKSILLIRDQEGMLYDRPYYYANEAFVFRFNAENELVASVKFPKKQTSGSGSDMLGSILYLNIDTLYLIFNDNPKNHNVYRAGKLKTMKRRYSTMFGKYDLNTGEFTKEQFRIAGNQIVINPVDCITTANGNVLMIIRSEKTRLISLGEN